MRAGKADEPPLLEEMGGQTQAHRKGASFLRLPTGGNKSRLRLWLCVLWWGSAVALRETNVLGEHSTSVM